MFVHGGCTIVTSLIILIFFIYLDFDYVFTIGNQRSQAVRKENLSFQALIVKCIGH